MILSYLSILWSLERSQFCDAFYFSIEKVSFAYASWLLPEMFIFFYFFQQQVELSWNQLKNWRTYCFSGTNWGLKLISCPQCYKKKASAQQKRMHFCNFDSRFKEIKYNQVPIHRRKVPVKNLWAPTTSIVRLFAFSLMRAVVSHSSHFLS